MKKNIKKIIGEENYNSLTKNVMNIVNKSRLKKNFAYDLKVYKKHSRVFNSENKENIESEIIMAYHSLEKGFLFDNFKQRFGIPKVKKLIRLLTEDKITKSDDSQIQSALMAMCEYYEKHLNLNCDISDYYPIEKYNSYKNSLSTSAKEKSSVINHTKADFLKHQYADFKEFSNSRKSIRNYTGETIPMKTIESIVDLAKNAPSVCNRQASKIYYTENKEKIDQFFKLQGGFNGYYQDVKQLFFVTVDRSYFYTVGERYQFYIDGGLILMNLLYAIHYHGVGACPANWGMPIEKDFVAAKIFNIPESEKIICLVPIGVLKEEFKSTLSWRKNTNEILKIVN